MILAANRLLLLNGSKRNAEFGMRNAKFKYRNSKMKFENGNLILNNKF